ncbi:MAG: U32 family peptidase [Spirochaetota bacterium]
MVEVNSNKIELLAPAKDIDCGKAAIDSGADAVYIGGPDFGARKAAANTVDDIASLVSYAHRFHVNVYAALNTILKDDEIDAAVDLIKRYHAAGVDGVLIQDVGLLECDLPPIALIASTQMDNSSPGKVAFLEKVGFQRAVLARELSIDEIRAIRSAAPSIELECFVHGALCVGMSGQCYMSVSMGGRSGNRGECAQPCRKPYELADGSGKRIMHGYPLSLADLDRSQHIEALIDSGVTSFKIEGRLKDRNYVANVCAFYRNALDTVLAKKGMMRSSSGRSTVEFTPNVHKTFNRGYTDYFIRGGRERAGSVRTPKMIGERVGAVRSVSHKSITLDTDAECNAGDGLSFFVNDELSGTAVEGAQGNTLRVGQSTGMKAGMELYRNRDHRFITQLSKSRNERSVAVRMTMKNVPQGVVLSVSDEDDISIEYTWTGELSAAEKKDEAEAVIRKQLMRTGGSGFHCTSVDIDCDRFIPASVLNAMRREALSLLVAEREKNRPRFAGSITTDDAPYIRNELDHTGNVLNEKSKAFYRRHGVGRIGDAAESGISMEGKRVMRTRYCIRYQLDMCMLNGASAEPLYLKDEEGHVFRAEFDCARCGMDIFKQK